MILLKLLFGAVSVVGTTIGGIYAYGWLKQKNVEASKSQTSMVDVFVKGDSNFSTNNNLGDKNKTECKFQDAQIWGDKFNCEVFSYTGSESLSGGKDILVGDFNKKLEITDNIPYINQYQKIIMDKKIWDKWSAKENNTKKITLYLSNERNTDLSLLFGVYENHIIKKDNKKVQALTIENARFVISK